MRIKSQTIVYLVILGSVILLTACQGTVSFVIVNESDRPLLVKYKMKLANYAVPGSRDIPSEVTPKVLDLNTWDKDKFSETDWQTKASTVESFDFDTGAFVLTVPPKEVVRILRGSDSLVYRDDSENFFPLVNLETSDDEGAVHVYPSGRMLSQFKERGKGNYFLANY